MCICVYTMESTHVNYGGEIVNNGGSKDGGRKIEKTAWFMQDDVKTQYPTIEYAY